MIDRIIARKGINDEGHGKKHALHLLMREATSDVVWLQDDDILPPAASDDEALQAMGDADMLILLLRMQSERENPSLLERLQIAEYAAIQQLTFEMAKRQHAVMCSGANMLVRRREWLASEPDLHPEIPSGDDMFLLESFKRRGLRIAVSEDERLEAYISPQTTWSAFWRQRMRWAGKAPKYRDVDILLCGAVILGLNMLQLFLPLILLVKFPLEYLLIHKREPSISIWTALLLEVLYPIYMLICLLGGLFRKHSW